MTDADIRHALCTADRLNPDFVDRFEPDEKPVPRDGCTCDNCFYGRDRLAVEILRLRSEVMDLADVLTAQTYDTYRAERGDG